MKKTYFQLLFLSLSALPYCLNAQNITWQKLNGPSGGTGEVYPGKDGYLILLDGGHSVFRSNDGGHSWERMPGVPTEGSFWPLAVGADGNLYTGNYVNIYRSENNGESWSLLSSGIDVLSVYALPDGVLLVGTGDDEIIRSADNGQTWQVAAQFVEADGAFAFNPYNGDVYAWGRYVSSGTIGKLWRSTDHGQTWEVAVQAVGMEIGQMAFSPNGVAFAGATNFIWRSLDNGETWMNLSDGLPSFNIISVAVSPTGRLFSNESINSRYSDDNGETWHPLTDESGNNLEKFSSDGAGKIFACRRKGSLLLSEDDGATWQFAAGNIFRSTIRKMVHLDAFRILAYTYDGVFYSNNGGNSWELVWDKVTSDNHPIHYYEGAIAIAPDSSWYIWDGTDKIIRFTEEGQSHTVLQPPGLSNQYSFQGVYCNSVTGTIFVSTNDGLYASTNLGQTWTLRYEGFYPLQSFVPMPDGSLLNFDYTGIQRSTDDGYNWTTISSMRLWAAEVKLAPNGMLYGHRSIEGLYRSMDEGLTWEVIPFHEDMTVSDLSMNSLGHVFAYDFYDNIVHRSVDGGYSYHLYGGTIPGFGLSDGQPLSVGGAQHLFVNMNSNGAFRASGSTTNVKLLTGKAWHDLDENCNYAQPVDTLLQRQLVKLIKDGEVVYGYANNAGQYFAPVTAGDYEVAVVPLSDYWLSCTENVTIPDNDLVGQVDSVDVGIRIGIECPLVSVSISAPFLRRCLESQIYVRYENRGTIPAEGAYLTITLDPDLAFNQSSLPVAAQIGDTYMFQLGDLAVGVSGMLILTVTPSCELALGHVHCVEAHIYPDEFCIETDVPQIVTSAHCAGENIELQIDNIGTASMVAPLSWFVVNPGSPSGATIPALALGTFQLDAGATFTTTIAATGTPLDFYAEQAPEYPFNAFSVTSIQGCGAGEALSSSNNDDVGPFIDQLCQATIGAVDPNDKLGMPVGLTENGYIEHDQSLTYLIRFQNTGTDTAFNVNVRDTLPETLDPATVMLLNASHPCDLRILSNGALMFVFDHIMLPDSNVNEAASHGFVQFAVRQKQGNPTGALIQNKASIYFDFNEPVSTNTTLHTVGIPDVVITDTEEPLASGDGALQIMPNPFREAFTVTVSPMIPEQALRLLLIDSNGKVVAEKAFNNYSAHLGRANLPQGVYHYLIVNENGKRIGNGTVVAQ